MHTLQTLQILGLDPASDGGPPRHRARRRARALGARRPAVLRRRGRAVHQRPHDRDRRLLRGRRRPDRRADPRRAAAPTAAGTARPRTGRCARRSTRRSTCSTGCSSSSARPAGPPPSREARRSGEEYLLEREPVPPQEHRRGRRSRRISTSRSRTTGSYDVLRALDYFRGAGRRPGSADGRGRRASCGRSGSPTAGGCSTASTPVASTSTSRTASGAPSRWNTLRALRVLDWWDAGS